MCEGFVDEIAELNSYSSRDIIESMTIDDVKKFLVSLGVTEIQEKGSTLILPTICHNPIDEAESMKLYYYNDTRNFHCYTECSENFNIFELYRRYMDINCYAITYSDAIDYVKQFVSGKEVEVAAKDEEEVRVPQKKLDFIDLPEITDKVMDCFVDYYHPLWKADGISEAAMKKFGIKFCVGQNRIVIPHTDINGKLVGIRGRAIEEEDVEQGKYRPIKVGDTLYNHQLGFNLYGINEHKEAIAKFGRAVIYEGEKSVLLDETYYGKYSLAVATCGSQLNRFQINLLTKKLGVSTIILAYDKEYVNHLSEQGKKYKQKLIDKCSKYKDLATFYYIFDTQNLLEEKDAPCDRGKEKLEKLMKRMIKVI